MILDLAVRHLFPRYKIRDREGNLISFILNDCQEIAHKSLITKFTDHDAIRCIVCKSRQVGMSYYLEGLLVSHCAAIPNAQALIVAHQHKPAKNLFDRARLMWECLPMRTRPEPTQEKLVFPHKHGNSFIMRATAGSVSARSMTLSAVHLSEAAYFPDEEGFLSLLPTVPERDNTILAIESTANGVEGLGEAFYEYWLNAVEGRSEFLPIFIAWYEDPECMRHYTEAEDAPLDDEEKRLMEIFVGRKWDLRTAQSKLAWRRWAIENKCRGYLQTFHREFPSHWEQAFTSSGDPAFTPEELAIVDKSVKAFGKPLREGALELDETKGFRLKPWGGTGTPQLRIWRMPQAGHEYYVGADCARGPDDNSNVGDFSAAVIWDGTTGEQCLTFQDRIGQQRFAWALNILGRAYEDARMNIELTGGIGSEVMHVLRDEFHYRNWYIWKGKKDDVQNKVGHKLCWETTWYSRERMFTHFREAIRAGEVHVADPLIHVQMSHAMRESGRIEIKYDHDDVLFASTIGWVNRVDYPPMNGTIRQVQRDPDKYEQMLINGGQTLPDYREDHFPKHRRMVDRIVSGRPQPPNVGRMDW